MDNTINFKIWIDADACPKVIKEVVYKTCARTGVPVTLVANSYMTIPHSPLIRLIQVEQGADVADSYIVEHLEADDIIITADIPLASLVVEKGALAINPRGELYTEENISERLSMRDFMQDLRDSGMQTGGPAPFGPKDKESFANSLNKILTKKLK
ncbi:YaiI/YqxD family protein [Bacteriovorax sp. Seq25_V]|uniref:YaiI/YqxD family protein n=1 Tax=Bacteriovorax sp. Seq25_V TaxID=1201288 RepID=UPI00038A4AF5|nr:YaiI/YqxD family protein [Bacteriovorax sp. Seq25_V]EQC43820.1 YaiI/YqxD family protein [Bacteriovorax sp. Seq25_V]